MVSPDHEASPGRRRVTMLLDNPCSPDWRVLKEARALVETGHEVTVVAWDRTAQAPATEVIDGVRIERIRLRRPSGMMAAAARLAQFWWRAARKARAHGCDAVHAHDLTTLPAGVALSALLRAPLVYDAHELYWLMVRGRVPRWAAWSLQLLERVLIRRAETLITVSDQTADYFRRHHRNVLVIGNWYESTTPDADQRAQVRARLGIDDDAVVVASLGTLAPERLQHLLLDLPRAAPGTVVILAGRGPAASALEEAAKVHPGVHFLGWSTQPEELYAATDILFYGLDPKDAYSEISSPNTVFVAIARTIPLITTAAGTAGHLVAEHDLGEVVAEQNTATIAAAVTRLREAGRHRQVVANLRALQGRFSWERGAEMLRHVYGAERDT